MLLEMSVTAGMIFVIFDICVIGFHYFIKNYFYSLNKCFCLFCFFYLDRTSVCQKTNMYVYSLPTSAP